MSGSSTWKLQSVGALVIGTWVGAASAQTKYLPMSEISVAGSTKKRWSHTYCGLTEEMHWRQPNCIGWRSSEPK